MLNRLTPNIATTLIIGLFSNISVNAASLQANLGVKSSHFLDGVNLTDDSPAVSLDADWSFDNGGYTGVDCYASTVDIDMGLDFGCDYYVGYFRPLNNISAFSAQITHHDYSRGLGSTWDFTDIAANWHINKKTVLTAIYSEDWLDRSFDTFGIKGATQVVLSDKLNFNLSASLTSLQNPSQVDTLVSGKTSLSYSHQRWTTEAGFIFSDTDQQQVLPFDVDEIELFLTISYRLY